MIREEKEVTDQKRIFSRVSIILSYVAFTSND